MKVSKRRAFLAGALLAGAVMTIGSVVAAKEYRQWKWRMRISQLATTAPNSVEHYFIEPAPETEEKGAMLEEEEEERDNPMLRRLALRALFGDATPQVQLEWANIARAEATRWSDLMPTRGKTRAALPSLAWVNLGPNDAAFQDVGSAKLLNVDAGRVNQILVDPRDANVVYIATSGGGVWKTYEFVTATNPTWHPITETLGNLAIGAIALDPTNPDTLFVGVGDAFDVTGNLVYKSTDGGGTWSAPVALGGSYPASAGGMAVSARAIRSLKVAPNNPAIVLAATDVALFRSTNGGGSFALVDLPNFNGVSRPEGTWSLAYVGSSGGQSQWLVTGQAACGSDWLPPWPAYAVRPGQVSYMKPSGTQVCSQGNGGDLWRSVDSGATWSSLRGAAAFPVPTAGIGRVELGVGDPASPATTVVYAYASSEDEAGGGNATVGLFRSINGGQTFTTATGTLSNPTSGSGGCTNMNVAHDQSWYNLAIAVDPTNPARVIVGGNLCSVRTNNGLAASPTWDNVSHWMPPYGGGLLPYVHADFHAALVSNVGGVLRIFVGSDGGLFASTNAFSAAANSVVWAQKNKGVVTHLCYSVGSGDPANGNPYTAITGLQDNGGRLRDPTNPTAFNQIIGGDGTGAAVHKGTTGEWIWGSSQFTPTYCRPGVKDCNTFNGWTDVSPAAQSPDQMPFLVRFAPIQTDTTGAAFLTISNYAIWKSNATPAWTRLWPPVYPVNAATAPGVRAIFASQNIPKLYGAALSGGTFIVTSDEVTWTQSVQLGVGAQVQSRGSTIAFPGTTPAGKNPGDVYLAGSAATLLDDYTPVPASVGRLFLTTNRGASFTPFHGNGTGQDLPNVPIQVVRYDPGDTTNNTIYVGTDLGMYRTVDGGATWQRFGYGLPLVRVTDMFIAKNSSLVRISTFGRGLWEIYPDATAPKGVSGNGDYDRDLQIDLIDLAALASRMGTTPATTTWPSYSWLVDLNTPTPAVSSVDDADLNALLSKFGGTP